MPLSSGRKALIAVLVVLGLYFLIWHVPPLPLNHEDLGMGKLHIAHALVGVVLLAGAWWIRRSGLRVAAAPTVTAQQTQA